MVYVVECLFFFYWTMEKYWTRILS